MCECEKDKKSRAGAHLKGGRQKPAASIDEIRTFLENTHEETGKLATLRAMHEELGGSYTRLTKIREAFALDHNIKLDAGPKRAKQTDSPLAEAFDAEELAKSIKEAVNQASLQSTLAINDVRRDLARRMDQLEKNVRQTPNWRAELQATLIDTMSRMGLTQVIAPAIKRLVKETGGRRRRGRRPKVAKKPVPPKKSVIKPGRPPSKRAHPMEWLAYKRFLAGSARDRNKLLGEAVHEMDDNLDKGLALIRGCIRAAGGFEAVAKATKQRLTSLQKAFGPRGRPEIPETVSVLGYLAGVRV